MTGPAGAKQHQSEVTSLQLIGPDTDAGRCSDGSCLLPGESVPDVTLTEEPDASGG